MKIASAALGHAMKEGLYVQIENWLIQARIASGLSMADVAKRLYMSESTYRLIEDSPGRLSINQIRALLVVFNEEGRRITMDFLKELNTR